MNKFSIIIATCNRPDRLLKTLEDLRVCIDVAGGGHEIVIVDNGTERVARESLAALLSRLGLQAQYHLSEARNKVKALNLGITMSVNDWIAFTDDDCIPNADWLACAGAYAANSGLQVFGGRVVAGWEQEPYPAWLRDPMALQWVRGPAIVAHEPLVQSGLLHDRSEVPFGANLFVRKRVFQRLGMYDEELWHRCGNAALGCEDAEFAIRIRSAGEPIGYCAEAVVTHPVHMERSNISHHLVWAYRAGVREVVAFGGLSSPWQRLYYVRQMFSAIVRVASLGIRRSGSRRVGALMKVAQCAGSLVSECRRGARDNLWDRRWFVRLWRTLRTRTLPARAMRAAVSHYYRGVYERDLASIYGKAYHDRYGAASEMQIKTAQATAICRALPSARKVVVAGCSNGRLVAAMRESGRDAWGFDVSSDLFRIAVQDLHAYLRLGSLSNIPFSDKDAFDALVGVDVLEHIPEGRIPRVVAELVRLRLRFLAIVINHTDLGCPGHVTLKSLAWWDRAFAPHFVRDPTITFSRDGIPAVYSVDNDPDSQFTFWRQSEAVSRRDSR